MLLLEMMEYGEGALRAEQKLPLTPTQKLGLLNGAQLAKFVSWGVLLNLYIINEIFSLSCINEP